MAMRFSRIATLRIVTTIRTRKIAVRFQRIATLRIATAIFTFRITTVMFVFNGDII